MKVLQLTVGLVMMPRNLGKLFDTKPNTCSTDVDWAIGARMAKILRTLRTAQNVTENE